MDRTENRDDFAFLHRALTALEQQNESWSSIPTCLQFLVDSKEDVTKLIEKSDDCESPNTISFDFGSLN
jgi:hypothetical protein